MRVHFLVNIHRDDAIQAARKTAQFLSDRKVETRVEDLAGGLVPISTVEREAVADCDLVISFGGDGTLIRAAQACSERGTPILGVYYGRFGFVTQCHPNEIGAAISQFLDGKAKIESRMMVRTTLVRNGTEIATLHALNEAAVQRAATTRMLDFEILVDGQFLTRYPADGVVVASTTGSTAYNLSTGGPIVDPNLDALLLSAIAPHTLSARPLVLRPDSRIVIRMETRGDAILSCDGQSRLQMASGDEVCITQSERRTRLVTIDDKDFLTKLRGRLLWSDDRDGGGS